MLACEHFFFEEPAQHGLIGDQREPCVEALVDDLMRPTLRIANEFSSTVRESMAPSASPMIWKRRITNWSMSSAKVSLTLRNLMSTPTLLTSLR